MTRPAAPISLYVHLPWCVRKCPYCDFNSHARPAAGVPEAAYVAALVDDLELAAREAQGRRLISVFFGGGTPSLFSAESIGRVLEAARRVLPGEAGAEVTLEANPGTVERGRFREYRAAGVNRVSLGAQSFDDAKLAALGRIHASGEIDRAVDELHAAGMDNFNLDLMYALPGQTVEAAELDVARALALRPAHVSHYQLTLEPDTPFAKHPPAGLPDEEAVDRMLDACQARLADAGFERYEVSAYARAGRRSVHNQAYWRYGDYLGVGAGAHGKVSRVHEDAVSIVRTVRVRHPVAFMGAALPTDRVAERFEVDAAERPFEFCLNALRLVEGFDGADFERSTGLSLDGIRPELERARDRGLLVERGGRWQPTTLGLRFLNDLQAMFLPS